MPASTAMTKAVHSKPCCALCRTRRASAGSCTEPRCTCNSSNAFRQPPHRDYRTRRDNDVLAGSNALCNRTSCLFFRWVFSTCTANAVRKCPCTSVTFMLKSGAVAARAARGEAARALSSRRVTAGPGVPPRVATGVGSRRCDCRCAASTRLSGHHLHDASIKYWHVPIVIAKDAMG